MKDAKQLAFEGMTAAMDHADRVQFNWTDEAFNMLQKYLQTITEDFQCEDFREYCKQQSFTEPPSNRAYGGIIRRAAVAGIIKRTGYRNTKGAKAHCTPAAVWEKV